MARSNPHGLALVALTARLPWWIGVLLAVASYLGLPVMLQESMAVQAQPRLDGHFVWLAVTLAFASVGQYVLPFVFALGALVSLLKQRQGRHDQAQPARQALPRGASAAGPRDAADPRADALAGLTWREFETLVGAYFRHQGYEVTLTGGGGPDGGVDVLLRQGGDTYLVQCKHWRASRVGVKPVRELYGVMAAERAAGGFVVTSGDFTQEARQFAKGRELQLIDGRTLRHELENAG